MCAALFRAKHANVKKQFYTNIASCLIQNIHESLPAESVPIHLEQKIIMACDDPTLTAS